MKAVGLFKYLPIEDAESLVDLNIDTPEPKGCDLLVAVKAVSVNPVDTKLRAPKDKTETDPRILGFDAAGEVVGVGPDVKHFAIGDRVYYAGDITRAGSNSEYQLIDERIVGAMPSSLTYEQAAALPLTSITAWEALFDRLGITRDDEGKSILMIGGAGGVGSIAIQLAKQVAKLKVIASASRPASTEWALKCGADLVVDHHKSLPEQLEQRAVQNVDYISCLNSTAQHWQAMAEVIAPQGKICSIVESPTPVDINLLKSKSATFVWEFMFTRSMYKTHDMAAQGALLNSVAQLIENGAINSTANQVLSPINAANLRQAHALIESGNTIGKIVLSNWQ